MDILGDSNELQNELEQIDKALLGKFAQISEAFGIQGFKQQLLGALVISYGEPRSLTELTRLTHFSKASVSRAMRELQMELPFIETVKKPQDKEKYYQLGVDILDFLAGFMVKTVQVEAEPTIKATRDALSKLQDMKTRYPAQDEQALLANTERRVAGLKELYEKYIWYVTRLLEYMDVLTKEWEKTH